MDSEAGQVVDFMDEADTVEVKLPPEKPRNIMDQAFWSLGLPVYVQEQVASWKLELERHIARCDGCNWCD
jgi:hypothetical protein